MGKGEENQRGRLEKIYNLKDTRRGRAKRRKTKKKAKIAEPDGFCLPKR